MVCKEKLIDVMEHLGVEEKRDPHCYPGVSVTVKFNI